MKVFNSPSFQHNNIGYGNYGTEEYRCNQIGDVVDKGLKINEFETMRNNPNLDLSGVIAQSNAYCTANDIHLSIHTNAGGGRGCTVFYYGYSAEGRKLAECIYGELSPLTPVDDRGVRADVGYIELKDTKAIAVIVEVSFHDNPDDAQWIINNIENIGNALVKGLCKYAGKEYKTEGRDLQKELDNALARALVAERTAEQLTNKLADMKNAYKTWKNLMEG